MKIGIFFKHLWRKLVGSLLNPLSCPLPGTNQYQAMRFFFVNYYFTYHRLILKRSICVFCEQLLYRKALKLRLDWNLQVSENSESMLEDIDGSLL